MAYCINAACHRPIDYLAAFCPYCGKDNRPPGHHPPVTACAHAFPFSGAYCPLCGTFDTSVPLAQATDAARRRFRRSYAGVIGAAVVLLVFFGVPTLLDLFPNHRDTEAARGEVTQAYGLAESGALDDIPHARQRWQDIQDRYGRVLSYRILSQRPRMWWQTFRKFRAGRFTFEVDTLRERAHTRERVEAEAGPSRSYGYWSGVTDVEVEKASRR